MIYAGDWFKDTELAMCSPSARGIWFEWLLRMREQTTAGRKPCLRGRVEALARLARCSPEEALKALTELQETDAAAVTMSRDVTPGHADVTGLVTIENRRMSREWKASKGAAERQREKRKRDAESRPCHADVTPPSSSSSSLAPSSEDLRRKENPVGDRSDLATDLEQKDPAPEKPKGPSRKEIDWRVADTWEHFLERRARYYRLAKGMQKPPGSPPTLDDLIRADIRRALRTHDADLLGADHREAWQRLSKTRAAGGGMYLTSWNLGKREERDADGNGKRATTYLEAWRPWRIRKGRDPVNEYAETYFEKRALSEAQEQKS
jgi:hypothetical protein